MRADVCAYECMCIRVCVHTGVCIFVSCSCLARLVSNECGCACVCVLNAMQWKHTNERRNGQTKRKRLKWQMPFLLHAVMHIVCSEGVSVRMDREMKISDVCVCVGSV